MQKRWIHDQRKSDSCLDSDRHYDGGGLKCEHDSQEKTKRKGEKNMKRVSVIVIHDNYKTIKTMVARYNQSGELIRLITDTYKPYRYDCINDLYKSVLTILKNNNMYAKWYGAFGVKWYDIQWINEKNPLAIESFGYNEKCN